MRQITLVFPDQLFEKHPALDKTRHVVLAEEFLYFRVQPFHRQRLILLRAAMQQYRAFLESKGYTVHYIESSELPKRKSLITYLKEKGIQKIHLGEICDAWLSHDLKKCNVTFYPTPAFLSAMTEPAPLNMASFYREQRKKTGILMKKDKPIGGKYSFDTENRKKLPSTCNVPKIYRPKPNRFVEEALSYVERHFPDAVGDREAPFIYPTNFKEADQALEHFIQERLEKFGDYEDAISTKTSFVFHSVLSPLLNIGLLTPHQVIEAALNSKAPLNSLEGFIRQILGWREFMRAMYLQRGNLDRTSNFFKHTKPLPKGFWDGTTGIEPVDYTIKSLLQLGYCHHIERLMVLGNYLLLTGTDPHAVYTWFMAYFVDAYDWVMVPNVYGMSQFANGGAYTTKPYFSGSNYLLKMSDYKKGEWCAVWDELFWGFLAKHRKYFEKNVRMRMLLSYLDKKQASAKSGS